MSAEKSLAVVMRLVEFSETSYVVTLFTEDFGKISALAKGARRRKSPFEAALDLLAICRVVFLHKQSESLDLLTEAKLERRFRAGARDLKALYAGFYVIELLDLLTDRHDPSPALFRATVTTIAGLDEGQSSRLYVTWWECQALRVLGHFPELETCVECGRLTKQSPTTAFGLLVGGVLCDRCKQGQRQLFRVSRHSLDLLQQIAQAASPGEIAPPSRVERSAPAAAAGDSSATSDPWAAALGGELRGLMNQYLAHLLGRKPRMHQYLGGVTT